MRPRGSARHPDRAGPLGCHRAAPQWGGRAIGPLTVIFTSDFHNRLDTHRTGALAELARDLPGAILLDGGDAIRAGNAACSPLGEPVLARMTELGYSGMALGNREFHVFPSWLRNKTRQAGFPLLAANVRPKTPGGATSFTAHVLIPAGALVLGVFGVLNVMVRPGTHWARISGYEFGDPVEVARTEAEMLRPLCDVVVALTHCPREAALAISELAQVDMTLAGHIHGTEVRLAPGRCYVEGDAQARTAAVVRWDPVARVAEVVRHNLAPETEAVDT